jgi:predicted acetyltransferase
MNSAENYWNRSGQDIYLLLLKSKPLGMIRVQLQQVTQIEGIAEQKDLK